MTSRRASYLTEGIVVGLLGLATVAVWFALLDLLAGRSPFYTSSVLGSVLLYGATDPGSVSVAAAPVLAYSALHAVVFLVIGVLMAWLASLAGRGMQLWYVAFFGVIFIGFHLFGAVQLFAAPMSAAFSGAMVWGAGIAASVVMMLYLVWRHPSIVGPQTW